MQRLACALAALSATILISGCSSDLHVPPGVALSTPSASAVAADPSLVEETAALDAALDQVNTAMGGYPDSLYWFQVSDLNVSFFDSHRLADYAVTDDSTAYTACLFSANTGDWVLFDSTSAKTTGHGTYDVESNRPAPDCTPEGQDVPTIKALTLRTAEIDAASLGDLINTYLSDTDQVPGRPEAEQVAAGFLTGTNTLAAYRPTGTGFSLCVVNTDQQVWASYDSTANPPVVFGASRPKQNCEP